MTPHDSLTLLDHAATAYALADGGCLVWGNRTLHRLAQSLGIAPEELIQRAEQQEGATIAGQSELWRARVSDTPAGKLIEWIPSPDPLIRAPVDSLTGLLNRESIQADLHARFAKRHEEPFALVFADLDDFKQVNDRLGHLAGDRCLEVIGERLRGSVRAGDAVGRFGGDEFLILLSGVSNQEDLQPVLKRLRDRVTQPIDEAGQGYRVGLSLGAADSQGRHDSPEAMIAAADRAMYADKQTKPAPSTDIADSARLG